MFAVEYHNTHVTGLFLSTEVLDGYSGGINWLHVIKIDGIFLNIVFKTFRDLSL